MLSVSEVASRKLTEILASRPEPVIGLRVHVMSGCCSGPSYGLSLATESQPGDWTGEFGGVKLLVDPDSAPLLEGAEIDYVETPGGAGFTIQNPNAAPGGARSGGGCACGGH